MNHVHVQCNRQYSVFLNLQRTASSMGKSKSPRSSLFFIFGILLLCIHDIVFSAKVYKAFYYLIFTHVKCDAEANGECQLWLKNMCVGHRIANRACCYFPNY